MHLLVTVHRFAGSMPCSQTTSAHHITTYLPTPASSRPRRVWRERAQPGHHPRIENEVRWHGLGSDRLLLPLLNR
jgi:hypothetical protein